MKKEKLKARKFLGGMFLILLSILEKHKKEGYLKDEIIKIIKVNTDHKITNGALHTTLQRMENSLLVSSKLGEPSNRRGGKPRRIYNITKRGAKDLSYTRRYLLRLWGHKDI
jgi:PadR family transcriptional regulator, regulatory protein PadR